jgi:hypothetical protein
MSNQIVISSGAKVRNLSGVLTGTAGVVDALGINVANGIPQLDGSGKILVSQLPNSVMEYKGTWNAATNTPTLANGTGNQGDVYLVSVAGTVNFGAGPITFAVGDQVIYSGTIWQKAGGSTGTVTSVAVTESGDALTITGSPITTSGTINIGFAGTSGQYVNGAGGLTTFPSLTGFVPYTGATANVDLGTFDLTTDIINLNQLKAIGSGGLNIYSNSGTHIALMGGGGGAGTTFYGGIIGTTASFASSGGSDTFAINHSSGSGIALNITKGGAGEGLYINKTSGSGNAATIIGTLNATTIVKSGGTSSQYLMADGSVSTLTNPVTGTGTTNTLPKFTGASTIGNSNITDSGSLITLGSNTNISSGGLGIGSSSLTGYNLRIAKNLTGATSSYAIRNEGIVQSDVTANAIGFRSDTFTAAASFTITNYWHFWIREGSIGAGSAITNQYGYHVDSNMISATNNFAFSGAIPSGTNRWNLYMSGTAANYLNGSLGIGTTSISAKLHVSGGDSVFGSGNLTRILGASQVIDFTNAAQSVYVDGRINGLTLKFYTNTGNGIDISNTGSVGIGSTSVGSSSLLVAKTIAGGATRYGIWQAGQVQSDVTTLAVGIYNQLNTQATAFTLGSYAHLLLQQGTIGANSAISNQFGIFIDSTMTGATNNYGIYGAIAAGTGRWNLYMAGTAANYMAGVLNIGTTTLSGFSLDVNGTARVSGLITSNTGNNTRLFTTSGATTGHLYADILNTGGRIIFGVESSVGGSLGTGYDAYASVIASNTNTNLNLGTNGIKRLTINGSTGNAIFTGDVELNGASGTRTLTIQNNTSGDAVLSLLTAGNNGGSVTYSRSRSELILGNSGAANAMVITSSGNVGINTTNASAPLAFQDSNALKIQFNGNAANYYGIEKQAAIAGGDGLFKFESGKTSAGEFAFSTGGTNRVIISASGVVTISNLSGTGTRAVLADSTGVLSAPVSDISVKQNISPIGYGLNEISKMNPVWFDFVDEYKNYGEGRQNGNIAQEMAEIIPEAVFITPSTGKMGINYDQLHAVYIKAIQELKAEIEDLKAKIK